MGLSNTTIASSVGAVGFAGCYWVLKLIMPTESSLFIGAVATVSVFLILLSAYFWFMAALEWWEAPTPAQLKNKTQAAHNSLVAFFNEGNQLDYELNTDRKSVEGTPRMKEWTSRVQAFLRENRFSQADLFAFENVPCNEGSSYQWGHKLRLNVLRGIISKHSKELA